MLVRREGWSPQLEGICLDAVSARNCLKPLNCFIWPKFYTLQKKTKTKTEEDAGRTAHERFHNELHEHHDLQTMQGVLKYKARTPRFASLRGGILVWSKVQWSQRGWGLL